LAQTTKTSMPRIAPVPVPSPMSRRALLGHTACVVSLMVLPACSKKEPVTCGGTNPSAEDQKIRTQLQYTDQAAEPARVCKNCVQYVEASEAGACGTCKLIKGPIHPRGTCAVFTPMS